MCCSEFGGLHDRRSFRHFAGDGFQNSVGAAALLHRQIEEGWLAGTLGLHGFLIRLRANRFKYFCRDFLKS